MKPINPEDLNYPEWVTDPNSDQEYPEEDWEYHKTTSMGMEWKVVVHPGTWKGTYVAFCQRLENAWVVENRKEDCLRRIGGIIELYCVEAGRTGQLFKYLYEDNGFSFDEFVKIDGAIRGTVKKEFMKDLKARNRLKKVNKLEKERFRDPISRESSVRHAVVHAGEHA